MAHPSLEPVLDALRAIAPEGLAASWDNVGLLLEGTRAVRKLWLCVDLTEAVLEEALTNDADLVVAYHPPIFKGRRRLTESSPLGRVVLTLVRSGVHLYSPHTALDAAAGGMNDWLLEAFGATTDACPIEADPADPSVGSGRTAKVSTPRGLSATVKGIAAHLGLDHVRVAAGRGWSERRARIRRVAVCPGAGGSVFQQVRHADLFLTGELRHHDVLARVAAGSVVVLTDHTNTERGYLPRLAARLAEALPEVQIACSAVDRDPLVVTPG